MNKKLISIFTPVFNESANIATAHLRVKDIMIALNDRYDYEHIFSDNGSEDDSFPILQKIQATDANVKVIKLSRNFGVTKNTVNGLNRSSGDAVIQLDADLQDPPELIPQFIKEWEDGNKVVYGIRADRDEFWLMKLVRSMFYRVANQLATETLIPDVGEFRLVDKRIIHELKQIKDQNPYLRGIVANLGFKQKGIPYKRDARQGGRSSHNILSLIDYGINGIVSHSKILLRISTTIGLALAVIAFIAAAVYIIARFLDPSIPAGITSIMIFILFFSGIQLIFLGLLGEYISRIFEQSIDRPIVVEEELLGFRSTQQKFATSRG